MIIDTKSLFNISSFDINVFWRIMLLLSVFIISLILGNLYVICNKSNRSEIKNDFITYFYILKVIL